MCCNPKVPARSGNRTLGAGYVVEIMRIREAREDPRPAPFEMYCNGVNECVGQYLGVARVVQTTNFCSVASEAASVAASVCPAGQVITRWFWAPGVMPPEMATFQSSVTTLETAFGDMLGGRAELALSLAYIDRLRTKNNIGNPLTELFEGDCALAPLVEARQNLFDAFDAAEAAAAIVDEIEAGLPGV